MRRIRNDRDFVYSALGAIILGGIMVQLINAIVKAAILLYVIFGEPHAF